MSRTYAAMESELLVIEGDGERAPERHLQGSRPTSLASDPSNPDIVYCGTAERGLWRSSDAGESWQPVGEGVIHPNYPNVTAVAADGSTADGGAADGVVYAGTEPSHLFRSEDGGDSWREMGRMRELPSFPEWSFPPRPWTNHVRWISPDPVEPERLFVCIEAGALIRSYDGGETWEDRTLDGPIDTHTLSLHPDAPERLYSSAGDGFFAAGRGYSESRDSGESWERFPEGLNHHYLWGLAVDPGDPETILVSAASDPRRAHSPGEAHSTIYRRSAGSPWREVSDGLSRTEGRISSVFATDGPGVFYALDNYGVYRSSDAGETWRNLDVPWPEHYEQEHPQALLVTGDPR